MEVNIMYYNNYDGISNYLLGAKVKAAHKKHLEKIEMLTPQWILTGKKFRAEREKLNISRKQLSRYMGISPQVIAKFEKGKSIRSRNMFKQSYLTALELIEIYQDSCFR